MVQVPRGGWVTLLITGLFVAASFGIRRHYRYAQENLRRLDDLLLALPPVTVPAAQEPMVRRQASTVKLIMVSGYNGLGMHVFLRRQTVPRNVPELRLHLRGGRRHERVQGGGGGREPGARPPGAAREVRGVREGARLLRGGPNLGGDGCDRVHHPPRRGGGKGLPDICVLPANSSSRRRTCSPDSSTTRPRSWRRNGLCSRACR